MAPQLRALKLPPVGLLCLFVIIPLSHGRDDSVDQSMHSVCSSNLPGPVQALSTPTEEYCETRMAQSGSRPLLAVETRQSAMQTEPTRSLRWVCAIRPSPHGRKQYVFL